MIKPALTTEIGISAPSIRLSTLPSVIRREPWRLSGLAAHPFHGFFWITRGQGRLSLGGHLRGIGLNTLIFVPAGVVHAMEYGPSLQGYVAWLHRDLPVPVPDIPAINRASNIANQGLITAYFEQLSTEFSGTRLGSDHALESYLTLISVWLERNRADNSWASRASDTAAQKLLARFLQRLESHFHHLHAVSDYALGLNVTPTHLSRLCRAQYGKPASEMISDRLMTEARRHLSETRLPIADISRLLGFSTAGHFSRQFSAKTGQTPKAFREKAKTIIGSRK